MVDGRIEKATSTLTSSLLCEARGLTDLKGTKLARQSLELRRKAWEYTENGEMNAVQLDLVLKAIDERRTTRPAAKRTTKRK